MTDASRHNRKTTALVAQSAGVWIALMLLNARSQRALPEALPLLVLAQGLWLYRLYAVAHEASHKKLYPDHLTANDLAGSFAMLWVWAPLTIFRQIHNFHHGANRRADGVATLDRYVVSSTRAGWVRYASWYLLVFGGGFFVHTLASILLFLILPQGVGKRLSPAFIAWTPKKRLLSWIEFAASIGVHACLAGILGLKGWLLLLGAPVAVFAWIWSAMLYIYHYRTTVGRQVRHNVRSLPDSTFFSWLLLNFNHHSVHHFDPEIPWYELPRHENPQAEDVRSRNDNVPNLAAAILQQLKGPTIIRRGEDHAS